MLRLFRHYIPLPALYLALVEALALFGLLNLVTGLPGSEPSAALTSYEAAALPSLMTVAACLTMSSLGLYDRNVFLHLPAVVTRLLITIPLIAVVFLAIASAYGALRDTGCQPCYGLSMIGLATYLPLAVAIRGLFIKVVDLEAFRRRILVVGSGDRAARIDRLAKDGLRRDFVVVGYVRCGEPEVEAEADSTLSPVLPADLLTTRNRLAELVALRRIDEIVIATRERRGLPVRELLDCRMLGARVTDYHSFWEVEAGEVVLEDLPPSWFIFSDGFRMDWVRRAVKRALDIVVSGSFLVFTLPITIPAALAIRLTSSGPVLFRQERVGLRGRTFDVLKFRTMRTDAEKNGPQYARVGDTRATAVGRFLRRSRIDEIPQAVNVLKGDMSFIGPRPERPVFVDILAERIPYYAERHRVKPGITGWAQVNYPYGASEEDARRKLAFDLYYLKNGGLFLDIVILVQTVRVILLHEGSR
ncbi:MAG: TIGR03013 family PEP-CTERM/XrtA system glycosyltransferase [Alphaproteobacteria bacterium]